MIHRIIACLAIACLFGCEQSPPQALGTLEWDRVNGRAPVSEVITEIFVSEGEVVSRGAALLQFDDRKIRAEIDSIESQLRQAQWSLQERIAGPRPQTIAEEKARLASSRANLTNAQQVYDRRKSLYARNQISKEQLDWARKDYLNAQAQVREREESLSELRAGTRIEQVEQSRAQVAALNSQLDQLRLRMADYTIAAARAGRVDSIPFKLGDRPPVNAVVVTLLSGERPWARVYIPEPYRSTMKPGQTFRILVDGQDSPYSAKLRTISSEASFTPYYALTEKERSRLVYVAELDLTDERSADLTAGTPVQLILEDR